MEGSFSVPSSSGASFPHAWVRNAGRFAGVDACNSRQTISIGGYVSSSRSPRTSNAPDAAS